MGIFKKCPRGNGGRGLAAVSRLFNYVKNRRRALKKLLKVVTCFRIEIHFMVDEAGYGERFLSVQAGTRLSMSIRYSTKSFKDITSALSLIPLPPPPMCEIGHDCWLCTFTIKCSWITNHTCLATVSQLNYAWRREGPALYANASTLAVLAGPQGKEGIGVGEG